MDQTKQTKTKQQTNKTNQIATTNTTHATNPNKTKQTDPNKANTSNTTNTANEANTANNQKKRKTPAELRHAEELGGHDLWQSFRTVTTLQQNKRATGPLAEILKQIRENTLTDANWLLLQSRVIGTQVVDGKVCFLPVGVEDERLSQPPFSTNTVQYVVHRHSQRAAMA